MLNKIEAKLGKTKFGALLTMSGKIYSALVSYITLIIIARLLSVENFGVYTFFMSLVTFLVVVASAGSENILLSLVSKRKEKGAKYFQRTVLTVLFLVTIFSFLVIAFMLLTQGIIGEMVNIQNYREGLLIFIWVVFFQSLIIYFRALNQAEFLFIKAITPENYIRPTILFFLVCLAYLIGISNLKIISISYLLSFLITAIIVVLWKTVLFKRVKLKHFSVDKEVLKLFPQFMSIKLLNQASNFLPVFLMGIYLTSDAIGIFRASQQTTILVSFILVSVNMVFAPTISNLYSKNKLADLKAFYAKTTKWTFVLGGYISALVMLNSDLILNLFGQEFTQWNMVLIVLAFGQLVNASTGSSGYLLLMTNNQRYMILLTLTQVVSVIILSLLTVNVWGIYGIAVSVAAGIIILNILQLLYVWWKLGIHPIDAQYIGVIFTIVLSGIVTWGMGELFINQTSIINSIILSILYSLVFVVVFLKLGLTRAERREGFGVVKGLYSKIKR
ncbi:oligosaccharide flippase family protein [Virgibacillus sp. MSP4-1]|uniref:lipopolysaccharide biosynthesis protein n=1 Tax=Virgibacillus sp. MSP4-1 TaxID=2700081 RepID=UPI0003A328CB|nr:oligosaccharide flippase family protein [Virgibacillus sp. MSP4-1]QHS23467.1 oligosaccharide flippase family protein [Virgibacillus sp. MSP4-1]